MALPADFSKIFGSTATGGLTPIGDVNYAKGWEFVGANPPTKNDFSYLQNLSDLKSQWLYSNKLQRTDPFGDIKSDGITAVITALANIGFGKTVFSSTADFIRIPDTPDGLMIQFVTIPVPDGTVAQQIPFTWKTAMSRVFLVGGFIGGDVTTRRCNAQISGAAGGLINATNSGTSLGTSAFVIGIGQA